MKASRTPVTPVKQSTVIIAGFEIIVVLLADGRVAAAFRMFCDMLGLDDTGQVRRVQSHRTIGDSLILAYIETTTGIKEANVIIAEAIPIWLAGIYPNKVSPEAREILRICQLDAVRTIRQKFFLEVKAELAQAAPKEEPAQAVPPKEEPESGALPPPEEEESYWEHMAAGYIGLEQEMRELATLKKQVKADRGQIIELFRQHKKRLDSLEAQVDGLTVQVQRLSAGTPLTAEHQGRLYVLIRAGRTNPGRMPVPLSANWQRLLGLKPSAN